MKKTYVKPHRRKNSKKDGTHKVSGHSRSLPSKKGTVESIPETRETMMGGTDFEEDMSEEEEEFWRGYREAKEFIEDMGLSKADIKSKEVVEEHPYFAGYNKAVLEEINEKYDQEEWEKFLEQKDVESRPEEESWRLERESSTIPFLKHSADTDRINTLIRKRRKDGD